MANLLDKRWNIYSIILIIQALYSLKAWFLWWIPDLPGTVVFFIIGAYNLFANPFWDIRNPRRISASVLIFFVYMYITIMKGGNVFYFAQQIMAAFTLIPLVLLKSMYQLDLLAKFQKVITVIVGVSLLFWIGHLVGIDLPHVETSFGTIDRGNGLEDQYYFHNHFLYLVNQTWMMRDGAFAPEFLRFSSVFIEPGYLAILMTFLLFVNQFNFKERRNIIYLVAIIATVSLAGFLMVAFAYLAHVVRDSKHGLAGLIIGLLVVFVGYGYFKDYNGGNNFINEGIIERLEFDQTTGNIAGYNRTSEDVDRRYNNFITSPNVIVGLGPKAVQEWSGTSVGYKIFFMQYGIIGLSMFLLFLFNISKIGRNYRSYILLLLYMLMFVRGHVTMFWHAFILVYICGVIQTKFEKQRNEKISTGSAIQGV